MTGLLPGQRSAAPATLAPSATTAGFDFMAFDVETANFHRGSVCAIGAVEVRGGAVVATHSWLTRPPADLDFFDGFNVSLHGITPDMVVDQPGFAERLDQLVDLTGGLPLVAHNAAFDMGAIREGCTYEDRPWPTVDYVCSLVMARRALDLISYRLPLVAHECGVELPGHHDPGMDSLACAHIVLEIARRRGATSLTGLLTDLQMLMGHLDPRMWEGCRARPRWGYPPPPEAAPDADPHHPLYGQVMVFTGALSIRRQDAWAAVAACGATAEKDVTKRTTMLVVGDGFSGNDPAEFYTGKAAKAAHWRAKGHPIEVLTEADLADLLADRHTSGAATTPAPAAKRQEGHVALHRGG